MTRWLLSISESWKSIYLILVPDCTAVAATAFLPLLLFLCFLQYSTSRCYWYSYYCNCNAFALPFLLRSQFIYIIDELMCRSCWKHWEERYVIEIEYGENLRANNFVQENRFEKNRRYEMCFIVFQIHFGFSYYNSMQSLWVY